MVWTVSAMVVAMAPVTKMEILMTHMISCSDAWEFESFTSFFGFGIGVVYWININLG